MPATARFDLRLDAENKAAITQAAALSGLSVSTFIRNAATRAAANVIADQTESTARAATARHRVATLDQPYRPNQRLQQAVHEAKTATPEGRGAKTPGRSLSSRLRGRATTRLSTDEIMRLTRGA